MLWFYRQEKKIMPYIADISLINHIINFKKIQILLINIKQSHNIFKKLWKTVYFRIDVRINKEGYLSSMDTLIFGIFFFLPKYCQLETIQMKNALKLTESVIHAHVKLNNITQNMKFQKAT